MEMLSTLFRQFGELLTWWVMISPWEQALRVRAGKHVRRLGAGLHFRIPFLDVVMVQSVRLRVVGLSIQTVMTKDRRALTVAGALGFAVDDIEKLYQTLHHAQDTLMTMSAMAIAESAEQVNSGDLTSGQLSRSASAMIDFSAYGLSHGEVRITDFAFVRTYRLISDSRWGQYGQALNVQSTKQ